MSQHKKNRRLMIKLTLLCLFMFGFSFALVPLYNILCEQLGINGKTSTTQAKSATTVDQSRNITIQFIATRNEKLPWDFHPELKQVTVHPGQNKTAYYIAKNNTDQKMTVHAVPSITPSLAAKYFHKAICFCFERQTLDAHQSVKMPLIFYVDPALPKKVHEITLSYTLFELKRN